MNYELETKIVNYFLELDKCSKINSIAIQGGYARNKVNEHSDLDIVLVFKDKPNDMSYPIKFSRLDDYKLEVRHIYLSDLDTGKWEDKLKYIYQNETIILFDRDELLKKIIEQIHMSREEQIERIVYAIKKLGNRGITYKGIYNQFWRGYLWDDPYDYWLKRDDIFSAQNRLNECVNYIYEILFAINKQYTPSSKWRYNILSNLDWKPQVLDISSLLICEMSIDSFKSRSMNLIAILTECIDFLIKNDLLPNDIKKYYSENQGTNYYTDNT